MNKTANYPTWDGMTEAIETAKELHLLNNRVLIYPKQETVSKGGIIIPPAENKEFTEGVILSIGPELTKETDPKVGEIVKFSKFAGSDIKHGETTYKLFYATDIMAIVRPVKKPTTRKK